MKTVLFDLGGVVLGWDPVRAWQGVLAPADVAPFLARIDFPAWNRSHDAGRLFADGEAELLARFPDDEAAVLAYRQNFARTLTGLVPGTGALLAELARAGVRLVALTNWSAETFPHATSRFGLLRRFEQILVSGTEGLAKPDRAIFDLAIERFGLQPAETVFVDDAAANVAAATEAGLVARHFTGADRFRAELVELGYLFPRRVPGEPVYHLADAAHWRAAEAGEAYPWSGRGLDYEREGYVHLSFAAQLPGVLERHYADVSWGDLVLLELDPTDLPIVVEDLGAGPFPHLFAPLSPAMVRRVQRGVA